MNKIIALDAAIESYVKDDQSLALEGFTHLIPFAAGHEIIRQKRKNLTLIRMTPDIIYDQLIGMGCVKKVIFSYAGNPGVGLLRRMRDAFSAVRPRAPTRNGGVLSDSDHSGAGQQLAASASASVYGRLPGSRLSPKHCKRRSRSIC